MKKADCYFLGTVNKIKGMNGEVVCYLDVDNPAQYKKLESVYVELDHELVPFFIEHIRLRNKNLAAVKFEDIRDAEAAKTLVKKDLYLPLSLLPPLSGKKFYFHEIMGFTVKDRHHGDIGRVSAVLDNHLNGILQIVKDQREILIPINDDIIESVDRQQKVMQIQAPEGLIDLYQTL